MDDAWYMGWFGLVLIVLALLAEFWATETRCQSCIEHNPVAMCRELCQ